MSYEEHFDLSLLDLPVELVLKILYCCDLPALGRLSQTCKEVLLLCADELLWRKFMKKTFLPIAGPSMGNSKIDRVAMVWKSLPAKLQCQLITKCKTNKHIKKKPTCLRELTPGASSRSPSSSMHRILLDDFGIWTSNAETVYCIPWRFKLGSLTIDAKCVEKRKHFTEASRCIGDFTVNSRHLATGHWDGSVSIASVATGSADSFTFKPHISDVHSVMLRDNLLVSGSRDHTVSFFDTELQTPLLLADFDDRIWSTTVHPVDSVIAVGTSGTSKHPRFRLFGSDKEVRRQAALDPGNLRLYDFEKDILLANLNRGFRHGFGMLALQFIDRHTLLAGGHDGLLRYWDMREYRCVQELDSDLDSAVYCFTTDGRFTVITGHANYNAVCLWDRRYTRYPIQTHSMEQDQGETKASGSIYGLCFTPFELYIGMLGGLYHMPFCS